MYMGFNVRASAAKMWCTVVCHGRDTMHNHGSSCSARVSVTGFSRILDQYISMSLASGVLRNAKVLTIHGEEDETIPVADAQEFDRHVAQHELVIVEGAGHSFLRDPERAAVIEALGRYLEDVGSTEAR